MNQQQSSFLSANVRQLLRFAVEPCRDGSVREQALQCLRTEGQVLLLEDNPVQFLLNKVDITDLSARNPQWYRVVLRRLSPLFNYCHESLLEMTFDAKLQDDPTLFWLTHPALVYESIALLQSRDDKCVALEVILALCPMIERSLGNLLYNNSSVKNIPNLLRDLVKTQDLIDIIGSEILILLLHILIGTPNGLNLRNLVWHGFPKPGEISPVLASSLIVLVFSIGETLICNGLERLEITRPCLDLLGPVGFTAKIERIYGSIPYTYDQIQDKFIDSIQPDHPKGPILKRVHKLLLKNKFRQSLYMLIPEWECQARLLFTLVNTCPDRSVTAESDTLYTTFDEILAKVRPDPEDFDKEVENLFPVTLGDQHMEFLLDCLILPEGPRLRDKISHGEIDLEEEMINNVFRMCIYIIMASYNDLEQYLSFKSPASSTKDTLPAVVPSFNDYTAIFHPKKLMIEEVDEVIIAVHNLINHPSIASGFKEFGPEDPLNILEPRFNTCLEQITNEHLDDSFDAMRRYCESIKVQTLYRPKYEYILTGLFRRILTQMKLSVDRSMENMDEKLFKYEANELNSRQLQTYTRMLNCVPRLCLLFQTLLVWILFNMENFDDRADIFKVGKAMLKYTENMANYTHISKNFWEESNKLVTKATKLILETDFLKRELKSKTFFKPTSAVIQKMPILTEITP